MIAHELRIGNWVMIDPSNIPQQVCDVMCDSVNTENVQGAHYGLVDAIPLTEEWLLKFGFKKKDGEWYLYPCFDVQIIAYNDKSYNGIMFYTRTIHTDYVPIYVSNHIEYVHQLQNLYFALTGKELKYEDRTGNS